MNQLSATQVKNASENEKIRAQAHIAAARLILTKVGAHDIAAALFPFIGRIDREVAIG